MTLSPTPEDTPRFDAPWHAQVFALTVALSEAGAFTWPEWTETFAATLRARGADGPLDGSGDYYLAWLAALEEIARARGFAGPDAVSDMADRWRAAYLATPHGDPVKLS